MAADSWGFSRVQIADSGSGSQILCPAVGCSASAFLVLRTQHPRGTMATQDKLDQAHATLWESGIQIRREVAGEEYVNRALTKGATDFARPMQELVTEVGWGVVWARPGLDRKTRSLLNIAMLCAINRPTELAVHVRGAINNGASEVEIRETILHASIYCGMPAGLEGTRVAEGVVESVKEERGGQL